MEAYNYKSKADKELAEEQKAAIKEYRESREEKIRKAREKYKREKAENAKKANEYGYIGTLRKK